jgi:putative peptidoglycan lipid II flippase
VAEKQTSKKSTISTLVVSGCTLISRLLGFVRQAVLAKYIGGGTNADILNFTFNIPNNLRKLMAEGALSSAFVPVLSREIVHHGDSDRPKKLVQNILALQFVIIIPLTVLAIIFAKPFMALISDYQGQELETAASLFRFFINYLFLISISAVLMGTLNSNSSFFIPAITPVLFSVFVISSIIFLHKSLGLYSMVVGVLAGGVAQVLFQIPKFIRLKYSIVPSFKEKNPEFKTVLINWVPILIASSIFSVMQIIAGSFATTLDEGSVTALTNSLVFFQLPLGIFSIAITTVMFPKMSRQAARDDIEGVKDSVMRGLNMMLMLLVPSMVILILFGRDMITAAFVRGLYSEDHAKAAALVLIYYAAGLFSVGAFNFLNRFFYSRKNFKIPLITAGIVAVTDISLSLILKGPLQASGLALANTIAFTLGFFILFVCFRKQTGKLHYRQIISDMLRILISMIPLGFFTYYSSVFIKHFKLNENGFVYILMVGAVGILAVVIVLMSYFLTKVSVLAELISIGRRKK